MTLVLTRSRAIFAEWHISKAAIPAFVYIIPA